MAVQHGPAAVTEAAVTEAAAVSAAEAVLLQEAAEVAVEAAEAGADKKNKVSKRAPYFFQLS